MQIRETLTLAFSTFFLIPVFGQNASLSGKITNADTDEPLISATVKIGDSGAISDFDGNYSVEIPAGTYTVEVSYVGFQTISKSLVLKNNETQVVDFQLSENPTLLQTATVTSGKYERPLSEVTVSLEVIKPQLLESVNTTSVDEVLSKVPGVDMIDGQANIRGGSGFSYGAGSRVLLLIDDIPILQADAGFPNWDDVPVENIDQIEVVKGAASALYGSSALNGIINIRTAYATAKPITKFAAFFNLYGPPAEKTQQWYSSEDQPYETGFNASHKQKIGKLDLVAGTFLLYRNSYNRSTYNRYGRFNLGLRFRHNDRLAYGFNSNFNPGKSGDYFFWKSLDSLYVGSDNSISTHKRFRFNIDPFLTYFDKWGNRHKLQGRYYDINNNNDSNGNDQSNESQLWYSEYQFQRNWAKYELVTTAGAVYTGNRINAPLYGDTVFSTRNFAAYAQLEKKFFSRLNASLGFRYEHNTLNTPEFVPVEFDFFTKEPIRYDTIPDGEIVESRPVWRFGLNYQVAPFTFLRGSWGQGYRFPTIAESFIVTNFGGVPISPNPKLQSETGWSAELAIKQGFRMGNFDGFLDIAAFWSQYDNMMEFNFINLFPIGFQSINVGGTDIKGAEVTIAGKGNFFGLPTNVLAGYTYLDPQFQEFDTTFVNVQDASKYTEGQRNASASSSTENILKYRFRHTAKVDVESGYKQFSLGVAVNYTSFMEAVDEKFVSIIVPGLRQFREENNGGTTLLNARLSMKMFDQKGKVSFICNNLLNKMYAIRPGLMEAPRSYTVRLDWQI